MSDNMTIAEFKAGIEEMRKVYPFKDDETKLDISSDLVSLRCRTIRLATYNKEHDTEVFLQKVLENGGGK